MAHDAERCPVRARRTGRPTDPDLWRDAEEEAVRLCGGWNERAKSMADKLYRTSGGGYGTAQTRGQRMLADWTRRSRQAPVRRKPVAVAREPEKREDKPRKRRVARKSKRRGRR